MANGNGLRERTPPCGPLCSCPARGLRRACGPPQSGVCDLAGVVTEVTNAIPVCHFCPVLLFWTVAVEGLALRYVWFRPPARPILIELTVRR
jgi:hypothetical protein